MNCNCENVNANIIFSSVSALGPIIIVIITLMPIIIIIIIVRCSWFVLEWCCVCFKISLFAQKTVDEELQQENKKKESKISSIGVSTM